MLHFILCAFDRLQERVLASRYQQQQPVIGPAEGGDELGAVLHSHAA
jgi:hypothetical protein